MHRVAQSRTETRGQARTVRPAFAEALTDLMRLPIREDRALFLAAPRAGDRYQIVLPGLLQDAVMEFAERRNVTVADVVLTAIHLYLARFGIPAMSDLLSDRTAHLAWAKERALQYVAFGDTQQAWASMCSDLAKHTAWQDDASRMLMAAGLLEAQRGPDAIKAWIEGWN